jgi:ATP-dependent DNA helicase RecQ
MQLRQFREGARAKPSAERRINPNEETKRLLMEGNSFEQIASARGRQVRTVVGAVAKLLEEGEVEFQTTWLSPEKQSVIEAACAKVGLQWLKPIKDVLPEEITYDEIRLVVARMRRLEASTVAITEEPKKSTA